MSIVRTETCPFPYQYLEGMPAWKTLDEAFEKLACNNDLVEKTDRRNIIGFLLKEFIESGHIKK